MPNNNQDEKIQFKIPSSQDYFCYMKRIDVGYSLTFYKLNKKLNSVIINESQIDREYLKKIVINAGIDFYALTGPYDAADEILKQWHRHFKKRGFLERLLKRS